MKITAFGASNSQNSINKQLANYALNQLNATSKELLDLNDFDMPLFSVDREEKGYPAEAENFVKKVAESDLIVISFAEHNRNFSATFKNLFDWSTRINSKMFGGKKMILLSTSPGGYGGKNALGLAENLFGMFKAEVLGSFSLPKFHENFEADKGITNPELQAELAAVLKSSEQVTGH